MYMIIKSKQRKIKIESRIKFNYIFFILILYNTSLTTCIKTIINPPTTFTLIHTRTHTHACLSNHNYFLLKQYYFYLIFKLNNYRICLFFKLTLFHLFINFSKLLFLLHMYTYVYNIYIHVHVIEQDALF